MKRFSVSVLLSLAVLGLAGCPGNATNSGGNTANSRTNTAMSNANMTNSNVAVVVNSNTANANGNIVDSTGNTSTGSPTTPSGFMTEAAKGGMAEIELSKVAASKTKNPEIKQFAQQMIADHTRASNELKTLAGKKTVTLPTEMDAMHKDMADKMSKMAGADFDKEYVNAMVADHEKTVNLFKTQSESGTDADAKAFAAKTLPTLQSHLTMIKGIQGKMK